jgi:hypothetical protein
MSKVRGILPLVLATSLGVANGMVIPLTVLIELTLTGFGVFGPPLKELQQGKVEQAR